MVVVRWSRWRATLAVALLAAPGAAGCATPGERAADASRVATAFLRARHAGDGHRACQELAPRTRQQLTSSAKRPCASAVTAPPRDGGAGPPDADADDAEVYGQQAWVRAAGDTLFLAHFPDGWKVTAAGCRPRGAGQSYDCELQGG